MSTARACESRDFHVRGTGDALIKLQLSLCAIRRRRGKLAACLMVKLDLD